MADTISVPREVLLHLLEIAEARKEQWDAVARGDPEDGVLELLEESDTDEGQKMAEITQATIDKVKALLRPF